MKEIETLETKQVYKNKWMAVREDKVKRASGAEGIFGVVEKPDFVVILPVHEGFIHIVEQYRYPVAGRFWELPQGLWEENADADHLLVAAGELREETGLVANRMTYLGHQFLAYGYSTQGYHIYLATELSGEIKDATSVNAYGIAKLKGYIKNVE